MTYLYPSLFLYFQGYGHGLEDLQSFCSWHYRPKKENHNSLAEKHTGPFSNKGNLS